MLLFVRAHVLALSLCSGIFYSNFAADQGGVVQEGARTVFRTGGSEPLLTFETPLGPIADQADILLEFDFGFSTSELQSPGSFYDSFSLTLQNTNTTALLTTADREGAVWTPPNPGGLDMGNEDLRFSEVGFPDLSPTHLFQIAFHVVLAIPRALTGGTLTLFADLFDNGNASQSLAFVSGMTLRTNSTPLRVESAAEADGPYQADTPVSVTQDAITVQKVGDKRFYRVSSARPTRILEQRIFPSEVIIDYRYEPLTGLRLQGATELGGTFVDVSNATWNPTNRVFSLPSSTPFTAFRVVGDHLAIVLRTWTQNNEILIEYRSALIELRSSAILGRPTSMVSRNPDQRVRQFRVQPTKSSEFFQVRSDVRTSINVRKEDAELVIDYEILP